MSGHNDGTCAQKTNAVDHLGTEPAHIRPQADLRRQLCPVMGDHVVLILAQQHGQRRPQAHQHIRPETGRPALPLPFQSDQTAKKHRHRQPHHHSDHIHLPQVVQYRFHSVSSPSEANRLLII